MSSKSKTLYLNLKVYNTLYIVFLLILERLINSVASKKVSASLHTHAIYFTYIYNIYMYSFVLMHICCS